MNPSSGLVAAPASAAGVDENEDYDKNGDGDERGADPKRLARERHLESRTLQLVRAPARTGSGVEGAARAADGVVVWTLIPLAGFVLGLAVARWWVVAAALPFGAYVLATNGLEGHLGEWVAFVLSTLLACAIACGVALRRLRRHA